MAPAAFLLPLLRSCAFLCGAFAAARMLRVIVISVSGGRYCIHGALNRPTDAHSTDYRPSVSSYVAFAWGHNITATSSHKSGTLASKASTEKGPKRIFAEELAGEESCGVAWLRSSKHHGGRGRDLPHYLCEQPEREDQEASPQEVAAQVCGGKPLSVLD